MKVKTGNKNFIYAASGKNGFDFSHCHKPTPIRISSSIVRVFFGVRDEHGRTRTTHVDLNAGDLKSIVRIAEKPSFELGKIGSFDDSGANVCSIIRDGKTFQMYYIGWNPSTTVHTRNSIGMVFSDDGENFYRKWDGSILDRDRHEPYYTGAVDVFPEPNFCRMWYTSGSEWKIIDNRPEIFYHIKYAESKNGIDWDKKLVTCIPPKNKFEVTARPSVIRWDGIFVMLYSRRDIRGFRVDRNMGYRAGLAFSTDGIKWHRLDHTIEMDPSDSGWDSEMICYPVFYKNDDQLFIFYNGNGFGKTGFGAVEIDTNELLDIIKKAMDGFR